MANGSYITPCNCGKSKRGLRLISATDDRPTTQEVYLGMIVYGSWEIIVLALAFYAHTPVLVIIFALPLPLWALIVAVVRLFKGHSLQCSLRWGVVSVLATARYTGIS